MFLLLPIFFIFFHCGRSVAQCPTLCTCHTYTIRITADCSHSNLTYLPVGLAVRTSSLRLGYNHLTNIENETFSLTPNLERLWLDNNAIEAIEFGAFNYLSSLSWLNLENNKITVLHPLLFSNLTKLLKLDLSGNLLQLPRQSPLLVTKFLQILDLQNCRLGRIPLETFNALDNLITLRLAHNEIRTLQLNISSLAHLDVHNNLLGPTTKNLQLLAPKLVSLDMSSCLFRNILSQFFQAFPQLEQINLGDNILHTIQNLTFYGLQELRKINLTNNLLQTIPNDTFEQNLYIESLDISNNPIELDENITFNLNSSSYSIIFSKCRLRHLPVGSLDGMPGTRELHLSNNKLEVLSQATFSQLVHLIALHLDGNKLRHLDPDVFAELPQLALLDLSRNPLQELPEDGPLLRARGLRALSLKGCGLRELPATALRGLPRLGALSLEGNLLSMLGPEPLRAAADLRDLRLAGNPWRCGCALLPLWRWCEGEDGGEGGGRCPDAAAEARCEGPAAAAGRALATALPALACSDHEPRPGPDTDPDAEWVRRPAGPAQRPRTPPDRLNA